MTVHMWTKGKHAGSIAKRFKAGGIKLPTASGMRLSVYDLPSKTPVVIHANRGRSLATFVVE